MSYAIDVIVPVYNRANYIENLIQELDKQTFRDFRVIFVDDGSTDGSCAVINKLLPKASFPYMLIQKENGGAGSARNAGMQAADAKWISFVDSDDGLHPEFLEYLYTAGTETEADLAFCNLQMIPEGSSQAPSPVGPLAYEEVSPGEGMRIYCTRWVGPVCLLINREFQQVNKLFFDEDCIYCEDAPFIMTVIAATKKVAYLPHELYIYYTHPGSLSRSPSGEKYVSGIEAFQKVEASIGAADTEAAKVFREMGSIRYYIATLRRSAVQLNYKSFLALVKMVDLPRYKKNVQYLQQRTQRLACRLLLFSKPLFYLAVRLIFKD